jgi:hypothetical protein
MNKQNIWSRILISVGAAGMLIGAVDPLEGSLLILPGSGLVLLGTFLSGERRALIDWCLVFGLIAFGVAAMFVITAFGGLGGTTGHSMWWALLMVPYPIGWVIGIVSLATRLINNFRRSHAPA